MNGHVQFGVQVRSHFTLRLRLAMAGEGHVFTPLLVLLVTGVLALILVSGILSAEAETLRRTTQEGVFWLLALAALSLTAAQGFDGDARDGTLDQAYVRHGSYIPYLLGMALADVLLVFTPVAALLLGLIALGGPVLFVAFALFALALPITAFRLFASAISLGAARMPGAGMAVFLVLAAPLMFLAVAGQISLLWALGLILGPTCLFLTPACLAMGHQSR